MNRRSLQDITLIVLCLAVLTAAPCAARQDANQAGLNPVKSDRINESLKNELWNLHTEYQLKIFDLHMEQGQRIVTAIGSHGYNTSSLDQTLDKILNHRQTLSVALDARDHDDERSADRSIRHEWKEFFQSMKNLIRMDTGLHGS